MFFWWEDVPYLSITCSTNQPVHLGMKMVDLLTGRLGNWVDWETDISGSTNQPVHLGMKIVDLLTGRLGNWVDWETDI